MNGFFSTESRYYKIASELAYLVMLGALWLVFTLPLITIGVSTTAAYYVATKRKAGRDDYLFSGFLKSYRENFLPALSITIIWAVFGFLIYLNISILMDGISGILSTVLSVGLLIITIQWTFITIFVFPILARFQVTALQAIKSAFFMSNRHFKTTLACVIIFIIVVSVGILLGPFLPFAMGAYVYLTAGMFVKVFRLHHPAFDQDSSDAALKEAAERKELEEVKYLS